VEQEVSNYLYASKQHKTSRHSAHSSGAVLDLLRAQDIRILVISSIVLQIAQQLSGINAVFYYSTTFFEGIIDNPLHGTILIGFINLLATILALKLMDNTERRTLLLISSIGMIVSMVFINLALLGVVPRILSLFFILVFVSSFAIGLGPIPWLIVAEMFDSKYVATAMSLACIINWLCNFLVGLTFPFLLKALQSYVFTPFLLILVLSSLFIYKYLPETHGKTVEEVYYAVQRESNMRGSSNRSGSGGMVKKKSLDAFEESMVDMPVIQAVEMLNYNDGLDDSTYKWKGKEQANLT
jgi:SP family facilitated glucose transporter-like MFS transporter 3